MGGKPWRDANRSSQNQTLFLGFLELSPPGCQAMDLNALIHQLNNVEPETINWRALADCTGPAKPGGSTPETHTTTTVESAAPTWVIEAPLLQRLQAHLGVASLDGQQTVITDILNAALRDWLQARNL